MDQKKPFFITTPIYYVNGLPHIGHAYTTVAADVIARYRKLSGREVFFSTGTDEHGIKIQKKAEEEGKEPQAFADEIAQAFKDLWDRLGIGYDRFIRTTESGHVAAVKKVLQELYDREAIYNGTYEGLYCSGCEQFKTEDDLVDGKCPEHDRVPEFMKEESYLMKMTVIQSELKRRIESDELLVTPEKYKAEILSFLGGETLEDVSISRKNVEWGIPLPFDPSHTTYVWVDAFLNYLTALGWNGDNKEVPAAWPADIHMIGKDILRVHATIWPAVLMHLGLPTQKSLLVNGFILSGGRKMSKTLGNVISVDEMLEKFGKDGTRYLLLSAGRFGDDVDLTMERMVETYNAHLANGLGNLVSRVLKLLESLEGEEALPIMETISDYGQLMDENKLSEALAFLLQQVTAANKYIDDEKPWILVKENQEKFREVMLNLRGRIAAIASWLKPFLPETSQKIEDALETGKTEPLFQRI